MPACLTVQSNCNRSCYHCLTLTKRTTFLYTLRHFHYPQSIKVIFLRQPNLRRVSGCRICNTSFLTLEGSAASSLWPTVTKCTPYSNQVCGNLAAITANPRREGQKAWERSDQKRESVVWLVETSTGVLRCPVASWQHDVMQVGPDVRKVCHRRRGYKGVYYTVAFASRRRGALYIAFEE